VSRPAIDPFGELVRAPHAARFDVLGARVSARSNSEALLALTREAFGALPAQRLLSRPPSLELDLVLGEGGGMRGEPPRPRLKSAGGVLIGAIDAGNFALVDPRRRRALVCVDRALLAWSQRVRYELILEQLQRDGFHRLRSYEPEERASFEVWLRAEGPYNTPP